MMAMTTSSSISVKPRRNGRLVAFMGLVAFLPSVGGRTGRGLSGRIADVRRRRRPDRGRDRVGSRDGPLSPLMGTQTSEIFMNRYDKSVKAGGNLAD